MSHRNFWSKLFRLRPAAQLQREKGHPRHLGSLRWCRRLTFEGLEDRACPSGLDFATYLGGAADDQGTAIAVDASGNSYVAGATFSGFPATAGAYDTTDNGGHDAFVAKFDTAGSLLWATYLGGSGDEIALGIALDNSGNVYVAGQTSGGFPTTPGAFQSSFGGGSSDYFVAKLNAAGSSLVYSTYLGGSNDDFGLNIAVDSSGNAFVGGSTRSGDFPTTVGAFQTTNPCLTGVNSATVTALNATGTGLLYSTYLGGTNSSAFNDGVYGIAVDGSGNAYVTGLTAATDFPTTPGALQATSPGSGNQTFVTKLNAAGSGLIYSTYLGSSGGSIVSSGIAIDSSGDAYITGATFDPSFPTTPGALQTAFGGIVDAFVSKLNPTGTALIFSTFLGGSGLELTPSYGGGIDVDASGNVYVTGLTTSTDFPLANPVQAAFGGGFTDAYVAKLNPSGTALAFSTYLGGSDMEIAPFPQSGIAVDAAGSAYVTGGTTSADFPTATPFQPASGGGQDAFIAKITDVIPVIPVTIDIKPGSDTNPINLAAQGVIPVTIFGSATFDVSQVDVSSVRFAGAAAAHSSLQDVNGDGILDLVLQFRLQDTNLLALYRSLLAEADATTNGVLDSSVSTRQRTLLLLSGKTLGGQEFQGGDWAELFLAGKALKDLLSQMALAGEI